MARTLGWVTALATAVVVITGCGKTDEADPSRAPAGPAYGTFGIDLSARGVSVKAGDDFFSHANGAWYDKFEIPPDKAAYGMFDKLDDEARERVRTIIEEAARSSGAAGSVEQKIGDFYASYMDTTRVEADGLNPLKPDLDEIAAIRSPADLSRVFGRPGFQSPVGGYIGPDAENPDAYTVEVFQAGLGLPDREYYLKDDPKLKDVRAAYETHVARMLSLAGLADAEAKARRILSLETKIARVHWEVERTRDVLANNNPKNRAQLIAFAPGLDWQAMLDAMQIGTWDRYNVNTPTALQGIARLVSSEPLDDWKAYLTYHHLHNHAPYLPKTIDEENFAFYGKVLSGRQQQRERWQRGVDVVSGALGEAIGQVYVKKHFPPEAKTKIDALIENLKAAYKANIEKLPWMGPETRVKALEKLAAFRVKVGYPVKWKDYSSMAIKAGALMANVRAADDWSWQFQRSKLGKPVDRDEWLMTPQTVNAYYNPGTNEITFPAAILQPPYFDPAADDAVNYGGVGAVIGHEIGHAFDDQGRRFDATGKLHDWWTKADDEAFTKRATVLVKQYAAFEALQGLNVNGAFTLGENVGDLGGLGVAYQAYRMSLAGEDPPTLDGLTGDQRFFLSWGQAWRTKIRDEALRAQVLSNPHSPARFRVNGTVRNIDAWYTAFDVQPGDALYLPPDQRVKIWQ